MRLNDVTPPAFACLPGGCPAVFETDRDTYLIIGRRLDQPEVSLADKIGPDETVIEVPADLLRGIWTK